MFFSPAAPSDPQPKPEPALGIYSFVCFDFFFMFDEVDLKKSTCKGMFKEGSQIKLTE